MPVQHEPDLHIGLASLDISFHKTSLNDIPVEIIRQIFAYCVAGEVGMQRGQKREEPWPLFDPLTLCLVCTAWRNIAIDHPLLWSRIVLRGESNRPPVANLVCRVPLGQKSSFRSRLARARAFPWTLHIQISPPATPTSTLYNSTPRPHVELSQLMISENGAQSFANLRRLRICGPARLARLQDLSLPNLEVLFMEKNSDNLEFHQGALPFLPRLTTFAAIDIGLGMLPSQLPWSRLTQLHLQVGMCHEDLVLILQNSTELQATSIGYSEPFGHTPDQDLARALGPIGGTVSLTKLKHMTFYRTSPFYRDLTDLIWPHVTHLRLCAIIVSWAPTILQKFGSLTHLDYTSIDTVGPLRLFVEFVDACPLLVRLVLNIITSDIDHRHLFKALTFDPSSHQGRLERLEELGIACTVRRQPSWDINSRTPSAYSCLEDMIESRTKEQAAACARLKFLAIRISQGREYNPAAKRVEEVLRSYEGRLASWKVIRGTGISSAYDGVFDSWGSDDGLGDILDT